MVSPVVSGDDQEALEVAVGHLPDTPLPWEPGNSAVAAHRDSFFRPLKDIRVGDRLTMQTTRGDFEYEVRDTKIVEPSDLWSRRSTPMRSRSSPLSVQLHRFGAAAIHCPRRPDGRYAGDGSVL